MPDRMFIEPGGRESLLMGLWALVLCHNGKCETGGWNGAPRAIGPATSIEGCYRAAHAHIEHEHPSKHGPRAYVEPDPLPYREPSPRAEQQREYRAKKKLRMAAERAEREAAE